MRVLRADGLDEAVLALGSADDDEIVALLPSSAEVFGSDDELEAVVDYFGSDLVLARGESLAAIGAVELLRLLLGGEAVPGAVDENEEVLTFVADLEADVVTIGGRACSVRTGQPLVVALVDGELGAFDECPPGVDSGRFAAVAQYTAAAAGADEVAEAASEILRTPMWSPAFCAELVAVATQFDRWGRDETDPVPGDELSLLTLSPRLFAAVEHDLERRIVPRLRRHWPHFAWCGLHDAFIIRYSTAEGAPRELPLHHDVAQISGSVRLNDGYTGGALEFPRQAFTTDAALVGELIAWPSLVTHPHRALPVTSGVKYNLTLWLRLPDV